MTKSTNIIFVFCIIAILEFQAYSIQKIKPGKIIPLFLNQEQPDHEFNLTISVDQTKFLMISGYLSSADVEINLNYTAQENSSLIVDADNVEPKIYKVFPKNEIQQFCGTETGNCDIKFDAKIDSGNEGTLYLMATVHFDNDTIYPISLYPETVFCQMTNFDLEPDTIQIYHVSGTFSNISNMVLNVNYDTNEYQALMAIQTENRPKNDDIFEYDYPTIQNYEEEIKKQASLTKKKIENFGAILNQCDSLACIFTATIYVKAFNSKTESPMKIQLVNEGVITNITTSQGKQTSGQVQNINTLDYQKLYQVYINNDYDLMILETDTCIKNGEIVCLIQVLSTNNTFGLVSSSSIYQSWFYPINKDQVKIIQVLAVSKDLTDFSFSYKMGSKSDLIETHYSDQHKESLEFEGQYLFYYLKNEQKTDSIQFNLELATDNQNDEVNDNLGAEIYFRQCNTKQDCKIPSVDDNDFYFSFSQDKLMDEELTLTCQDCYFLCQMVPLNGDQQSKYLANLKMQSVKYTNKNVTEGQPLTDYFQDFYLFQCSVQLKQKNLELSLQLIDNSTQQQYGGQVYISLCYQDSTTDNYCFTSDPDMYNFTAQLKSETNKIIKKIYLCQDCILKFSIIPDIPQNELHEFETQKKFLSIQINDNIKEDNTTIFKIESTVQSSDAQPELKTIDNQTQSLLDDISTEEPYHFYYIQEKENQFINITANLTQAQISSDSLEMLVLLKECKDNTTCEFPVEGGSDQLSAIVGAEASVIYLKQNSADDIKYAVSLIPKTGDSNLLYSVNLSMVASKDGVIPIPPKPKDDDDGLSTGAIVGIVVGCVVVVGGIIGFILYKRKKKNTGDQYQTFTHSSQIGEGE